MKKYAQLKEVEDITGLDLKDALMELYEGSGGCAKGMMPISKIRLPDGAIAQVFVTITTDKNEFIQ